MADPGPIVAARQLIEEYRDRCLWFIRPDYAPKSPEEILRLLRYIERYGDRDGYRRAVAVRQWLSRVCLTA